ncbi:MAG: type II toxin-antitoxin system VapC family toxin [Planctomycetota bacterium]|jgi:tRNA(fMet)-specific endonuclease VapC|nr:type II toxin-antitoxin system VapC family toxin [Planctomycetota bacterium]MDP7253705.1 type II toxin-antitoxin system VapC family toxin [Planctomycetota bacterium]
MIVLDTDHASELFFGSAAGRRLEERITKQEDEVVLNAITVEEQLRGWLAAIRRRTKPEEQFQAYDQLVRQTEFASAFHVLAWDQDAFEIYAKLRQARLRVGTQDLKIASITMAHGGTLLTRNTSDFGKVRGLQFENWLD